jgi:hypothetical protein
MMLKKAINLFKFYVHRFVFFWLPFHIFKQEFLLFLICRLLTTKQGTGRIICSNMKLTPMHLHYILYINSLLMYSYSFGNVMVSKLILLKWIFQSLHRAGR